MGFTKQDLGTCCCGGGCACSLTVCVEGCDGSFLDGALVVIKRNGSTVASGLTAGTPACIELGWTVPTDACDSMLSEAGDFLLLEGGGQLLVEGEAADPPCMGCADDVEVIVTASDYYAYDRTIGIACGDTITVKLRPTTDPAMICFQVFGCGVVQTGATVTLDGLTQTIGDGITSPNFVCFNITDPGTYTWIAQKSGGRWTSTSGTVTVTACDQAQQNIAPEIFPASGYECPTCCPGLIEPIPDTLFFTDANYGGGTLTYNAGLGYWVGTLALSFTNDDDCSNPPGACPDTTVTFTYTFGNFSGCPEVCWPARNCLEGTFCTADGGGLPSDTGGCVPGSGGVHMSATATTVCSSPDNACNAVVACNTTIPLHLHWTQDPGCAGTLDGRGCTPPGIDIIVSE